MKLLLAGLVAFLLYCAYRVWKHSTMEKPQIRQQVPDRFDGWEKEVERIFNGDASQ